GAVMDTFATSPEASSLYGEIKEDSVGNVIETIYQALFGRPADEVGKAYYEAAFADGTITAGGLALAILNASRGSDVEVVANKVAAANTFTELVAGRALDDPAFGTDDEFAFEYAGDDAA